MGRLARIDARILGQRWLRDVPMPWRVVLLATQLGFTAGAIVGFYLGLDNIPTVWAALIEGGLIGGIPMAVIGLVYAVGWLAISKLRERFR